MDRTEVLEQLEPITDVRVRDIEHGPSTRINVTPDMVTLRPGRSGRLLELAEEGVVGLTKFIELPLTLGAKLRPDTFGRVATELLDRKERYSLLLQDDKVVNFVKHHTYRTLNPERVLTAIERGIGGEVDFHRVLIMPERSAQLEVVGIEQRAVARGDLMRAGALVAFSPIGTVQPMVQSYVLRLACTNGMTTTEVLREFRYGGEGDDVWQFFRNSARDAYRSVGKVVDRLQQMRRERLTGDQRAMVLEAMIREARLGREAAETVRAMALAEPPQNTYDVVNLITWATSHLLERPQEIRRAQQAVASFAEETEHRRMCPVCHRYQ